jgi:CheY-like chemotaxis protein
MTISGREMLLVGHDFQNSQALTARLRRWGFRCHFASTVRAANELLNSVRIDVVLSNTHLPDGTGFGLVEALAGLQITAFICLPVEDSCFWLPAIDGGKACLGLPALRPLEFASALEEMARSFDAALQVN